LGYFFNLQINYPTLTITQKAKILPIGSHCKKLKIGTRTFFSLCVGGLRKRGLRFASFQVNAFFFSLFHPFECSLDISSQVGIFMIHFCHLFLFSWKCRSLCMYIIVPKSRSAGQTDKSSSLSLQIN
jgi:hypothetical protein